MDMSVSTSLPGASHGPFYVIINLGMGRSSRFGCQVKDVIIMFDLAFLNGIHPERINGFVVYDSLLSHVKVSP